MLEEIRAQSQLDRELLSSVDHVKQARFLQKVTPLGKYVCIIFLYITLTKLWNSLFAIVRCRWNSSYSSIWLSTGLHVLRIDCLLSSCDCRALSLVLLHTQLFCNSIFLGDLPYLPKYKLHPQNYMVLKWNYIILYFSVLFLTSHLIRNVNCREHLSYHIE
jgi:hypothetical protein